MKVSYEPADLLIVARRILARVRKEREQKAARLQQAQPPPDLPHEREEQRSSAPRTDPGRERAEP